MEGKARIRLGKKDRKEEREKKTYRNTNSHTEKQRNSIISTRSPSGNLKESESSNQFQNVHVIKLQQVLSAKFGGSVQERCARNRFLKGCNDDFAFEH